MKDGWKTIRLFYLLGNSSSFSHFKGFWSIYSQILLYSFSLRTVCNLLRIFAGIMLVLVLLQVLMSNNVIVTEFCNGVMLGMDVGSLIALVIIWVPIVNKLRRKVNKLIDDIGVNL